MLRSCSLIQEPSCWRLRLLASRREVVALPPSGGGGSAAAGGAGGRGELGRGVEGWGAGPPADPGGGLSRVALARWASRAEPTACLRCNSAPSVAVVCLRRSRPSRLRIANRSI